MRDRSTVGPGRRQFLTAMVAVAGTTSIAGCSALWDQTGATDVLVYNLRAEPIVVSVTITPTDAEELHTARDLEIAPSAKVDPVNRSKLPTNSGYSITVEIARRREQRYRSRRPNFDPRRGRVRPLVQSRWGARIAGLQRSVERRPDDIRPAGTVRRRRIQPGHRACGSSDR